MPSVETSPPPRRNRRSSRLPILIAAVLLIGLAACGDGNGDGYSDELRDRYTAACLEENTQAFCDCTLEGFEGAFTEARFEGLVADLRSGAAPPDEFIAVVRACIAPAGG